MSGTRRRVLALDLGTVRIGVAVSDPLGLTAQPHGVVRRVGPRKDLERIRALVEECEAGRVVIGHPLTLSGEAGNAARAAEAFAEALAGAIDLPVELWDERLSTVEAERSMIAGGATRRRRREAVDAVAAALILRSWLEARGQTSSST